MRDAAVVSADETPEGAAEDDAGDEANGDDGDGDGDTGEASNEGGDNGEGDENDDDGDDAEDERQATGTDAEVDSAKSPSPRPVMMIRRKRLGRPPKNRPPDWDPMVEVPMSEAEIAAAAAAAAATPRGRKGQQPQVLQQPIDKDGNLMDIVNDEVDLPEDPEGETKVDKDGHLLGDREYRCRTFTVSGRGDRLYMLSTEPARCVGFRDSYLFFTKHKRLYKIIVNDEEKRGMIERDIIPHSYKGRAIGIVTARSVFREFGALIVVGGRRITDDYEVAQARAEGAVEGELADPNDRYVPGEPYNKNQYVAWHGASAVYHSNAPAAPQQSYSKPDNKKRRVAVNDTNWQLEHARDASHFNSMLTAARLSTHQGVYDIHTNVMQRPAILQPQRARAVQIAPDEENASSASPSSVFPPLAPPVPRNFFVSDIYMETPPAGVAPVAYERLNGDRQDFLWPFQGLGAVSDDIKDLLPPECRKAFDEALGNEEQWFAKWGDEKDAMCRREPIIDKAIVPYAMTL
ncbi:Chromatin-remodelling complex, RSC SWI/SNF subunit Rsc7/Swp82 [Niveomyces insectorum RCEF 264]|uniref:Chromatin-remodelling complex, RSC SWI/SNF subunit Rsc7/Swp82 n=1 Tax=Niveomyces insectorum RCEF 264 TaxID=1081102 RepID=A0A167UQ41_9HYPO|nr:Chromatin-remodelling complex, RSC SWI/SNF subunit Rsc7/Swp82 [Niveomyces insectorum RCEF 264]